MKTTTLICIISVLLIFKTNAQSLIPLSKDVKFFSSFPDVTIDKTGDTVVYQDGETINIKNFLIEGDSPFLQYSFVEENEKSGTTMYNIKGSSVTSINTADPNRDTDTLFIVLDTVYSTWPEPYVAVSDVSQGGAAAPIWKNSTFGYIPNLEHGVKHIVSLLELGVDEYFIVLRENYDFFDRDTVYLSHTEAKNQLIYYPVDENGVYLGDLEGPYRQKFVITLPLPNGGNSIIKYSVAGDDVIKISDYYGGVGLHLAANLLPAWTDLPSYLIEFPVQDSITQNLMLTNDPENLASAVMNYSYHDEREHNYIGRAEYIKTYSPFSGNPGITGSTGYGQIPREPTWETTLFMDMHETERFGFCTAHYLDLDDMLEYLSSPVWDERDDSIGGFWWLTPDADAFFINDHDSMFFGLGSSYYWPIWTNNQSTIECESANMGFPGNDYNRDYETDLYRIEDGAGNLIQEGTGLEFLAYGLDSEPYTVEMTNTTCHFYDYLGTSKLLCSFDLSNEDKNPPPIRQVQLTNAGHSMKYHFEDGEDIILKFSASDFVGYDWHHTGIYYQPVVDSLTKVHIKLHHEQEWTEAVCQKIYSDSIIGYQYTSNLTEYLTSNAAEYDLRVYVEDQSGNSSEYTFHPAFIYGDVFVGTEEQPDTYDRGSEMIVLPNPASDRIRVITQGNNIKGNCSYEIVNTNGIIVKKGKLESGLSDRMINISDLPQGIYIITLSSDNQENYSTRFIKSM